MGQKVSPWTRVVLLTLRLLFLLAAAVLILDKLFVFVLVLDRLDHPQNPPPAALLVLLALVTLWGDVTVSAASVEAMADPEEVLFSHEGKREETRCMIATVYSKEWETSPSSPSSPGGVRQRVGKGYRGLGGRCLTGLASKPSWR